MKLDRDLQKTLLTKLAEAYPESTNVDSVHEPGDPVTINLWYLEEHGLVECIKHQFMNDPPLVSAARITNKGLDFLADDGGLTAILGTLTIKLHADTLRDMLESRISESDMPKPEKSKLIEHIRSLPAEALKTATTHLLKQALEHLPDAIPLLQKLLGSL